MPVTIRTRPIKETDRNPGLLETTTAVGPSALPMMPMSADDEANIRFMRNSGKIGVQRNPTIISKTDRYFFIDILPFRMFFEVTCFSERILGTRFDAFHAKNAFRSVFTASAVVRNIDIHRADGFAFSAVDTFAFVTLYTGEGKIAHRL